MKSPATSLGCDGFQACASVNPGGVLKVFERTIRCLARHSRRSDSVIRGTGLHVHRSRICSLQHALTNGHKAVSTVQPDEDIRNWSDDRIWKN